MVNALFRPMFTPVDMLTTTTAGALMLSGHWLASVPVMLLGAGLYAWNQRRMRRLMAMSPFLRKGR